MEPNQTPTPQPTTPTPLPTAPAPKPRSSKPVLLILLSLFVIALLAAGGYFYYQNTLLQKQINDLKSSPTPSPTSNPTEAVNTSPSPAGVATPTAQPGNLETYVDSTYKFQVTFSKKYKVEPNHYGWPKAALILYSGGQSYDLVIEVWDTKAEYEAKYQNMMDAITVVQSPSTGKYFTLNNANKDPEVTQIISTFKVE